MLGVLWDGVPSDATKNFSTVPYGSLCRSLPFSFQIYGWWFLGICRADGSVICLRNLEYICQAACYGLFSLGQGSITRVQFDRNDFYSGCLEGFTIGV